MMRRHATLRRYLMGAGFCLLMCVGFTAPAAAATDNSDEVRVLTNEYRRTNAGVPPLMCSKALDGVAQAWSAAMSSAGVLSHNPQATSQIPSGWQSFGENVAMTSWHAPAGTLVNLWINSAGHRANMIRAGYTHIGVGYVQASNGTWGTQVFAKYGASPDSDRVTITGTIVNANLTPKSDAVLTATSSIDSETTYVGSDGSFCITVRPGAGTVTLALDGAEIDQLHGATAGGRMTTYYIDPAGGPAPGGPGIGLSAPTRVADFKGLQPGQPLCFAIAGRAGIPTSATAVILNVTAAQPTAGGHALVYADSDGTGSTAPPRASTVNFEAGRDVANSAIVGLGPSGKVCVVTMGSSPSRLILDVSGYFTAEANVDLLESTRVIDTRPGGARRGPISGPVGPGASHSATLHGIAGIPATATAVLANITVTQVSGPGHLSMWAASEPTPRSSVVNYAPGQDKANFQLIQLDHNGALKLQSFAASAHVILDVVGYLSDASLLVAVPPARIEDTRTAIGTIGDLTGPLAANTIYKSAVADALPAEASAALVNVTAVQPTGLGHLRVYPDTVGNGNTPPPNASTLNYIPGRNIPNGAIVALPTSGRVQFYSSGSGSHVVVDLVGYVKPLAD